MADSLSRDAYFMNPHIHKVFLQRTVPQQLPQNFTLRPVPREISYFITSILQQLPETQQQSSTSKPSKLLLGNMGILFCIVSKLKISSWTNSVGISKISSCQALHRQLERAPSLEEIMGNWWKEQSQPLLHMWLRSSCQTTGNITD